MRKLLFIFLAALIASSASAKEYGHYDPKRLVTMTETPAGKKYGFDAAYLDQMLEDLASHAQNYPPQFDTPQDQQRAIQDVKTLSAMLDIVITTPNPTRGFLTRAALLNSMGHNLDIPGSAEKADSIFQRLLVATPADPEINYMYGTFLSGTGKPNEALPYLEKALAGGIADADYSIGMTYLALGDKELALKNLESYAQRRPDDEKVKAFIEAIRDGKVTIKKTPPPEAAHP